MLKKTKAAVQGRQCRNAYQMRGQLITLIDQVNSLLAGGAKSTAPLPQVAAVTLRDTRCYFVEREGNGTQDKIGDQPFGSMPRFFSSCRASSLNQLLSVILSDAAAWFSCSLNSGCMRIWNAGDCPPVLGVRSFTLDIVHTFSSNESNKVCTLYHEYSLKQTPSNGITSTERGLTTNANETSEAAMNNHITPLNGRNSLTLNKFTWRFLALNRHDKKAKPGRLSVEATTEHEARRILAPHFILSFAARLPVQEVHHA